MTEAASIASTNHASAFQARPSVGGGERAVGKTKGSNGASRFTRSVVGTDIEVYPRSWQAAERLERTEPLGQAREFDGETPRSTLASLGSVTVEAGTMNNGANEDAARGFQVGAEQARVVDRRSETGSSDPGIDQGVDHSAPLKEIVRRKARQLERDVLVQVLRATGGNEAQAARMLQMDCETLRRKLREYGIRRVGIDCPRSGTTDHPMNVEDTLRRPVP